MYISKYDMDYAKVLDYFFHVMHDKAMHDHVKLYVNCCLAIVFFSNVRRLSI